jgi:hypothetical protein
VRGWHGSVELAAHERSRKISELGLGQVRRSLCTETGVPGVLGSQFLLKSGSQFLLKLGSQFLLKLGSQFLLKLGYWCQFQLKLTASFN